MLHIPVAVLMFLKYESSIGVRLTGEAGEFVSAEWAVYIRKGITYKQRLFLPVFTQKGFNSDVTRERKLH
jgi:hypothetical protein